MSKLIEQVKLIRTRNGLSQRQVVSRMGLAIGSSSIMSRLEKGMGVAPEKAVRVLWACGASKAEAKALICEVYTFDFESAWPE